MYRESHPRARERTHIPERIGLCGPLSGCGLYHNVALYHSMGCYLVVKSATRPNNKPVSWPAIMVKMWPCAVQRTNEGEVGSGVFIGALK